MSNNKQSSVEWYSLKRDVLEIEVRLGKLSANEYAEELAKAEQQAKAIEKQQRMSDFSMGIRNAIQMEATKDAEKWFLETFGGNK